jgi:hypothetical protein
MLWINWGQVGRHSGTGLVARTPRSGAPSPRTFDRGPLADRIRLPVIVEKIGGDFHRLTARARRKSTSRSSTSSGSEAISFVGPRGRRLLRQANLGGTLVLLINRPRCFRARIVTTDRGRRKATRDLDLLTPPVSGSAGPAFGTLPRSQDEANFSTEEALPPARPRLSAPHELQGWRPRRAEPPAQGPPAPHPLDRRGVRLNP